MQISQSLALETRGQERTYTSFQINLRLILLRLRGRLLVFVRFPPLAWGAWTPPLIHAMSP